MGFPVRMRHKVPSGYLRTPDEIRAFFGDWDLIGPGLVILPHWWPDGPRVQPLTDGEHLMVGGVAANPDAVAGWCRAPLRFSSGLSSEVQR